MAGRTGVMVGFEREKTEDQSYKIRFIEIPIEEVMLLEKTVPDVYINQRGNDVTDEFIKWCKPLIGEKDQDFINFKDYYEGERK